MTNPLSILFSKYDREAANWLDENLGTGEKVLVYAKDMENTLRSSGAGGWLDFLGDYKVIHSGEFEDFDLFQEFVNGKNVNYLFEDRFSDWGNEILVEKIHIQYELVFINRLTRIYRVVE